MYCINWTQGFLQGVLALIWTVFFTVGICMVLHHRVWHIRVRLDYLGYH